MLHTFQINSRLSCLKSESVHLVCIGIELFIIRLNQIKIKIYLFSYSCFCTKCALASARRSLDGSNWWMNFFVLEPTIARYMIRTAYHIEGDVWLDCCLSCCCFPCSVNQLYQTTKQRGNPTPDGGKHANSSAFQFQVGGNSFSDCFCNCIYAACCLPCATGTILNRAIGLPFFFGCCCGNICLARNIVRYQYRIAGSDCWEDCIFPNLTYAVSYIFPIASLIAWPYFTVLVMQLLSETQGRSGLTPSNHYLFMNSNSMMQPGVQMVTSSAIIAPLAQVTPSNQHPPMMSNPKIVPVEAELVVFSKDGQY